MPFNLAGWHGVILVLVVLLLFAAPKLPSVARSLAQSITIFRREVASPTSDDDRRGGSTDSSTSDSTDSTTR